MRYIDPRAQYPRVLNLQASGDLNESSRTATMVTSIPVLNARWTRGSETRVDIAGLDSTPPRASPDQVVMTSARTRPARMRILLFTFNQPLAPEVVLHTMIHHCSKPKLPL